MQQALTSYLLNAAWQIPLVALCALGISRFAGLSPRARNRLWLAFVGLAAILPAVSLAAILPHAVPSVSRVPADAQVGAAAAVASHATAAAEPAISLSPGPAWTMLALSGLAVAVLSARLIVAAVAARRLVRRSRPVLLPAEVVTAVDKLARAHGRRLPPIRCSSGLRSPAVVGALRPVILIPDDLSAQGEDLRAALLHEMAHVVRHDYAVNLVCEVLTLPVCWHPALLALKAGVSRSRELACDAVAAAGMASPKTYAKCLVSLAQALGGSPPERSGAPALAVGLFGRSDLEDRLVHLMHPTEPEPPVLRAARLCGLAAVVAGLLGSAALLHVTPVFAQATARAAATPASAAVAAAEQARSDAGPAPVTAPGSRVILSRRGVIVAGGGRGHHHSVTGSDRHAFAVVDDGPDGFSPEDQRRWQAAIRDGEARAAAAEKFVNSPQFKARIARAQAQALAAEKMANSAEFKARIAEAQARATAAEARAMSPQVQAQIATAAAAAARVQVQASLERAQAQMDAAADRVRRDLKTLPPPDGADPDPAP